VGIGRAPSIARLDAAVPPRRITPAVKSCRIAVELTNSIGPLSYVSVTFRCNIDAGTSPKKCGPCEGNAFHAA